MNALLPLLAFAGLVLLAGGAAILLDFDHPGDGTRPMGFGSIGGGALCFVFLFSMVI